MKTLVIVLGAASAAVKSSGEEFDPDVGQERTVEVSA
jgi:hypothetical protein